MGLEIKDVTNTKTNETFTWLYGNADGSVFNYVFRFDEPSAYTPAYDGDTAEIMISQQSIVTSSVDGSGGRTGRKIDPDAARGTTFTGADDGLQHELAYDPATGELKFLGKDGNNYAIDGDLADAFSPTIDGFFSTDTGVVVQNSGYVKRWLGQTCQFYVSVDANQPTAPPGDNDNPNWELFETAPGPGKNQSYDALSDGDTRYYQIRNVVTAPDGSERVALSSVKSFTYEQQVNAPDTAPFDVSLNAN